jgi:hypothetical protein
MKTVIKLTETENTLLVKKFREALLLDEQRVVYDAMNPSQKMIVLHALKFPKESVCVLKS